MPIYWESYYRNSTIVTQGIEVNETKFIDINSLPSLF